MNGVLPCIHGLFDFGAGFPCNDEWYSRIVVDFLYSLCQCTK